MNRIKTRETVRNIKTLDKSAILEQRMRKAFIRNQSRTNELTNSKQYSPAEYAEDKINSLSADILHDAIQIATASVKSAAESNSSVKPQKYSVAKQEAHTYQSKVDTSGVVHSPDPQHTPLPHSVYEHGQELAKTQFKKDYAAARTIKQRNTEHGAAHSQTKETSKLAPNTHKRSIKTAQNTSKASIKTYSATEAARKTAQASRNASRAATEAKKAGSKTAKTAAKAVAAIAKAVVSGVKTLTAAIAAGGWVAVVVVVIICILGMLLASPFGILFSGDTEDTGTRMCDVVREINDDFEEELIRIKAENEYERLEISGTRVPWKDVLAVYAVRTSTDPLSPIEVVTVDDTKRRLLEEIFWTMNKISHHVRTGTKTKTVLVPDKDGNLVEVTEKVEERLLFISIDGKTASQMADGLSFSAAQMEQLTALLDDEFNEMWKSVIYGVHSTDEQIVAVAMSQLGNVGGEPYWSWYGFTSRVEWCACFVSWCANECGYIDKGIIPKFAWCPYGVQWFKNREQWMDNSAEPYPGMIVFFDWDNPDTKGLDGVADHVAVVERVEDGFIYTIEGNSGDSCRQRKYLVGHYEILGYGCHS